MDVSLVCPNRESRSGRGSGAPPTMAATALRCRSGGTGSPTSAATRRHSSACQRRSPSSTDPAPSRSAPDVQSSSSWGRCAAYEANSPATRRATDQRRSRRMSRSSPSRCWPRCRARVRHHGSSRQESTTRSTDQTRRSGSQGSLASVPVRSTTREAGLRNRTPAQTPSVTSRAGRRGGAKAAGSTSVRRLLPGRPPHLRRTDRRWAPPAAQRDCRQGDRSAAPHEPSSPRPHPSERVAQTGRPAGMPRPPGQIRLVVRRVCPSRRLRQREPARPGEGRSWHASGPVRTR